LFRRGGDGVTGLRGGTVGMIFVSPTLLADLGGRERAESIQDLIDAISSGSSFLRLPGA